MKKVLTILVIMIVAACAVFADPAPADATGAAKINIKVKIDDEYPRFQLATKNGAGVGKSNVADPAASPDEATMDSAEKAHLTKTGEVATVVFSINQIADARCFDAYTLTVTATDLVLVKSTDSTIDRDLATALTAATTKQKFTVVPAIAHAKSTSSNVADINYTGTDATVIKIDYQGVLVAAEDADQKRVEIGTATVQWTANADAMSGDYKATVTLTVTSGV